MQQDVEHPIGLDECTIGKAEYRDSDGKRKEIVLLDAIGPLVEKIPSGTKLLLDSKPIAKAWPLITDGDFSAERSKKWCKKRKSSRGDELETHMDDLMEFLAKDIPQAITSLQRKKISSWLTKVEEQKGSTQYFLCSDTNKRHEVSWPALEELCEESNTGDSIKSPLEIKVASAVIHQSNEFIHRLISHDDQSRTRVRCKIGDASSTEVQFHVPQRSAFLLTNLLRTQLEPPRGWSQLIDFAKEHPPALLLLDPPYPNLSAKRLQMKGSKYKPVDDLYDLWNMVKPVKQLLQIPTTKRGDEHKQDILIGCWVTNHAKAQRFILTKLFPAWDIQHVGHLIWIKVTTGGEKDLLGGELVFPLDNKQGRKPYEILLLGRSKRSPLPPPTTQLIRPFTTLFASVPLDHSRKPDVFHLLAQHLDTKQEPNVYELFARSLHTGPAQKGGKGYWVSIGNEPFKYNQESVGYLPSGGEEVSSTAT